MAVRISLSESDELSMPEEDVVVKQKPRAVFMATRETNSSPSPSQPEVAPSSRSYAPNGGIPTMELPTQIEEAPVPLEAAVAPSLSTPQESSRSSRSPGLLWSRSADLSLTGSFTVAGRRCVVSVGEDDQLHWVPEKQSRGMSNIHCTRSLTHSLTLSPFLHFSSCTSSKSISS